MEVSVKQGEDIQINLEEAFDEWDKQNTLTITDVESPDSKLSVEINDNFLKVPAKKFLPTTIDLVAHATDSLTQQTWDIPVTLHVKANWIYLLRSFWWAIPFLLALVAALLLLIFITTKRKTPPSGQTTIEVNNSGMNGPGANGPGVNLHKNQP